MPGMDGLAVQQVLAADGEPRPFIFFSGKGNIATSVRAMKAGAIDFLTKPVDGRALLAAIARAEILDAKQRRADAELAAIREKVATLTRREQQVLTYVLAGSQNRHAAARLGIAERTIKLHRQRIMEKLGLRAVADLVRLAQRAGIAPAPMS